MMRWSDAFVQRGRSKVGSNSSKTTKADCILWEGYFEGRLLCVVSTVRLTSGNMAHFLVSSNARIGENLWNLRGGHFVDLRVVSAHTLTTNELRRLGELARTEEDRPIAVRQGRQLLTEAIHIPAAS